MTPPSSVAVNALLFQEPAGGVERAVAECARALAAQAPPAGRRLVLHAGNALGEELKPASETVLIRTGAWKNRLARMAMEQQRVLREYGRGAWHHLGYIAPVCHPSPYSLSVYDITALTHPELCTVANRWRYGLLLGRSIRRARSVVVPSNAVAAAIRRAVDFRGRIDVMPLPLPAWAAPVPGEESLPYEARKHVLFAGDFGPKKNLPFLLRLYRRIPLKLRRRYPLVLVGGRGEAQATGLASAEEHVLARPYVDEAHLRELFRQALVLVYPSLDEGYGFPPLEAKALGTPCVVSDRGALPEVAGRAGGLVLPLREEVFAETLTRLMTDESAWRAAAQDRDGLPGGWRDYAGNLWKIWDEVFFS
ncbi:MAG: glycosyltransferase family 1 protein [Sumerlaeia bacterium]